MMLRKYVLFLAVACIVSVSSAAAETSSEIADSAIQAAQQESIEKQLSIVSESISSVNTELVKIESKIAQTKNETTKASLAKKKDKLDEKLSNLYLQFEAAATGGVRISDYENQEEQKKFDWQSELLEVFKPMIAEIKQLTENRRTVDKLRDEISVIENHLPIAQNAVKQIKLLKQSSSNEINSEQLAKIEENWLSRQDELANQLKLLSLQLHEKLNPPDEGLTSIYDKLVSFAMGRGLTIVMAAGAFLTFFLSFAYLGRLVEKQITRKKERQAQFLRRALRIVLQVFTILLSLVAAMLVLYVRDDWLILGFILLILLGVAWGLRQSAPKYVREVKLLLNMGPVRESERVIYNGLPWRVSTLNMYSTLTNPALTGGSIKLPVDDIVSLRSREFAEDEGWFPSMPGDYVVLDDGSYGPVLRQTPEIVQITLLGGSVKTYSTQNYLALSPRNISHGFGIFITFGLDYELQAEITQSVPQQLEASLRSEIDKSKYSQYLKICKVEFKAASGSSLDLFIATLFEGEAAGDYYAIERFLQKVTVDICSGQGWNIPFDNMTIHLEKLD